MVSNYQSILQPTGEPHSVFAVCWGRAGTWTGSRARTRARARLFVLSGSWWMWARPGAGLGARLGARLGPRGGSGASLAPSWWPPLWGAAGRPGATPGTVSASGTTLWPGVAAGTGATLAVTVEEKKGIFSTFIQFELCNFTMFS